MLLEMNPYIPAPPQPAPLRPYDAYTTWPGGVDPTARLFNTDNQATKGGRRRRATRRAATRRAATRRAATRRAATRRVKK